MKKLIYILSTLTVGLGGCKESEIETPPNPLPNGVARVAIVLDFPEFKKPLTRSGLADENSITHLWAFIFKQNAGQWVLNESIEPRFSVSTGQATAILEVAETTDDVRIVILANAPNTLSDATGSEVNFQSVLSGVATYDQLISMMRTTLLSQPQSTIPYTPNQLIPMSGQVDVQGISQGTALTTEALQLKRLVAKITVTNQASTNFTLEEATVCNAPRMGYLFDNPTTASQLTNYQEPATAQSGIDTKSNPIYIYESHANNRTAIIVKGQYQNQTYYYKLVMTSGYGANSEIPANEYRRNYWYNFIIRSVNNVGYNTLDEAIAGVPSNNSMTSSVDAIDLSSHDIMDNGEYFLGLSNSEFHIYASGELNDMKIATISYTEGYGNVKVEISDNTAEATIVSSSYAPGSDIIMNLSPDFQSCKLKITYGNLTQTVSVQREPILSGGDPSEEFTAYDFYQSTQYMYGKIDNMTGNDWLGLSITDDISTLGATELTNNRGGIYIKLRQNSSAVMRYATLYFSRHSSEGRLKVYLQQSFLTID